MVFLNEENYRDFEEYKAENSKKFFHDIVSAMSSKYSFKLQDKFKRFLKMFFKELNRPDGNIRFLSMGNKHIVSLPTARIVYYNDANRIRIYIKEEV